MRTAAVAILFVTLSFQGVLGHPRNKRQLSIFSVVNFPNEECTSSDDESDKGTCLTTTECNEVNGTKVANCASGFGVCCMVSLKECGGDIKKNRTIVMSPNYPSMYTTKSKSCIYKIQQDGEGICQIRLDLTTMVIQEPKETDHFCFDAAFQTDRDRFIVTTATDGKQMGPICGTLTGQHIYLESGGKDAAGQFEITTGVSAEGRKWKIQVNQIPCEATYKAPTDCTQYFTGISNTFTSFNHPGRFPRNHGYMICIRQEEGHCGIAYSTNQIGTNEDFKLHASPNAAITKSKRSRGCSRAQIQIRTNPIQSDIYCGRSFSSNADDTDDGTVYAYALPFGVFVNGFDLDQQEATGFSLKYLQVGCGERESPSKYAA